ncbi:MAG: HNH endonuclease [Terriglobia bacterium]|nr:HNH endonuclease [Terriglobia bacterium]
MPRTDWSRDQLIIAFNLYCRIPFGRIHRRNPQIVSLAAKLARTPSALAWKLSNFARLDPELQKRGIRGASHGSKAEETIWEEFNGNWNELAYESQRLLSQLGWQDPAQKLESLPPGKSRVASVKVRVNQDFFRAAVMASYQNRCCITGLSIPELLTASHIVPWSIDETNRTNPQNGVLLNAFHDRAFDCGLLTITPDFRVRIADRPSQTTPADISARRDFLLKFEGKQIELPTRFVPAPAFLRYHNRNIFRGCV